MIKQSRINARKETYRILEEHGLYEWEYMRNNRLKTTAGQCNYSDKIIEIAGWLIDYNSDEEILDAIIHEVAHALTRGHNHDGVWDRKYRELGGIGRATYSADEVTNPHLLPKYHMTCERCRKELGTARRRRNLIHSICKGEVFYTKITIKERLVLFG